MVVKLQLIAAVCENMGIGKNNTLPWRLKKEMEYFNNMTTKTTDASKKNVVIMGRRTWESIPPKFKPLSNRINFILSRSDLDVSTYKDCYSFTSLDNALEELNDGNFKNNYENVWVIGGSPIYAESMESKSFYRLYLTEIHKNFDCDTFFPKLDATKMKDVTGDTDVPAGVQEEDGVEFVYKVFQNEDFGK